MQPTIFALRGKSHIGKSTVIRHAYDILSNDSCAAVVKFEPLGKVDFVAILVMSGQRVGFISQGDYGPLVEEHLSNIQKTACSIIVCATRTRGGTVKVISRLDPPYQIKTLDQIQFEPSARDSGNHKMASQIIKLVKTALNA